MPNDVLWSVTRILVRGENIRVVRISLLTSQDQLETAQVAGSMRASQLDPLRASSGIVVTNDESRSSRLVIANMNADLWNWRVASAVDAANDTSRADQQSPTAS